MLPGVGGFIGPKRGAFVTDFREYATGSRPSDWDMYSVVGSQVNTADALSLGGRSVVATGDANGQNMYWTRPGGGITNCEVLGCVKVGATASSVGGVALRQSSSVAGYKIMQNGAGAFHILLSNVAWLVSTGVTPVANTRYWLRFRAQGTTLSAKVWQYGSAEPGSWSATTTDASYASGYLGFVLNTNAINCEFFSAVIGTGTAPGASG